jgi:tRNA (mo5U34)-methyltransferase
VSAVNAASPFADTGELRTAVAGVDLWYHVLDLGAGVETPGWFDARPVLPRLPFPEVRGRRCLDIGTYDGFFAFEMERRGAAEVVATDIADHRSWDWPPHLRARGPETLALIAGPEKGRGFEVARRALQSKVERRFISIYDLSPDTVGEFDVVMCGSLLLHLRDPLRALEAVRSVCRGQFLSMETIDLRLTLLHPRTPVARIIGTDDVAVWSLPNAAGHRRLLEAAGFEVERTTRPYTVPMGPAHPQGTPSIRQRGVFLLERMLAGPPGVVHTAALTRVRG